MPTSRTPTFGAADVPAAFVSFVICAAGREIARVPFAGEAMRIGRRDGADIVVGDPAVSGTHAEVSVVEGRLHLRDLDSKNGTRVNGRRVREAYLRPADVIEVGTSTIVVSCAPSASAADDARRLSFLRGFVDALAACDGRPQILERARRGLMTLFRGARCLVLSAKGGDRWVDWSAAPPSPLPNIDLVRKAAALREGVRAAAGEAAIAAPVCARGAVVAVLYADRPEACGLDDDDARLLGTCARLVSLAIENLSRAAALEEAYIRLAELQDLRDLPPAGAA